MKTIETSVAEFKQHYADTVGVEEGDAQARMDAAFAAAAQARSYKVAAQILAKEGMTDFMAFLKGDIND